MTPSIWVCVGCSGAGVREQGFGLDWVLLGSGVMDYSNESYGEGGKNTVRLKL